MVLGFWQPHCATHLSFITDYCRCGWSRKTRITSYTNTNKLFEAGYYYLHHPLPPPPNSDKLTYDKSLTFLTKHFLAKN
eukprot:TRINITY_DN13949_c0_g1_i1.p1 TRINITY_DN13949_c0_g1~~TRINITY_DN13949_c0_g1_i1.p1  ORF type:complete len:79 (+),score=8.58 TRINITY_DN13949_c0_g1_i1:160-396(+)